MTPNHGYNPNDPRAQQQPQGQHSPQQPPGQHQPPQQPQGQHSPQQPPGQQQPPQQPPAGGGGQPRQSQPGPLGHQPQSGHRGTQHPPGAQRQQPGQFGQGSPSPGGPNPPHAAQNPPMAGGMQAQVPHQQQRRQQPQRQPRQAVLQPITVDDIAAEDVATAERDTPIRTAVASMAERDVGSVVVVEDGEPVGVLTDRKVALALEDTPEVAQRTVGDLVSEDLVTVDSSMNVFDVVQLMGDNGIRRVPVVDDEGKLQGIVTLDDVIVLLGTELGNVAETVQTQIERL